MIDHIINNIEIKSKLNDLLESADFYKMLTDEKEIKITIDKTIELLSIVDLICICEFEGTSTTKFTLTTNVVYKVDNKLIYETLQDLKKKCTITFEIIDTESLKRIIINKSRVDALVLNFDIIDYIDKVEYITLDNSTKVKVKIKDIYGGEIYIVDNEVLRDLCLDIYHQKCSPLKYKF